MDTKPDALKPNSNAKDSLHFPVRPLRFDWSGDMPRYWNGNSAFLTHYWNSFSVMLPVAEKAFIDCIRKFMDQETNPEIKSAMKNFAGQEACHADAHAKFNAFLDSQGLPAKQCHERFKLHTEERLKKYTDPLQVLAVVVCAEHFTTVFARDCLVSKGLFDRMHPEFSRLWKWHAIEELEHKSIAFDVLKKIAGKKTYPMLCKQMPIELYYIGLETIKNFIAILKADNKLTSPSIVFGGLKYFFGFQDKRFFRYMFELASFFMPGFHPGNIDDRELVEKGLQTLGTPAKAKKTA